MRVMLSILFIFSTSLAFHGTSYAEDEGTHYQSTVVDSHIDTFMHTLDETTWLPETDIGEETPFDFDIPKGQEGGLDVPYLAAYTPGYYENTPRSISETLAKINGIYWTEANNPDDLSITPSYEDIEQAVQDEKIAAVPTIEGGYSMEEDNAIELLHQYDDLGVKALGFTWNYSNALGEGADRVYGDPDETPSEGGLTELGTEVAEEMNDLGMMIDVSHMARTTFWDVIEVSEDPVIASHSGVNALHDHQRNLTDEQLEALADNGGVVGIVFYPAFLTDESEGYVEDVVDHIDHAVDVMGMEHVALGSDFDGAPMPEDLQDASELYKITDELENRDYSEEDIEKILGENHLRVLEEVEQNEEDADKGVTVTPSLEMGEELADNTPILQADIEGEALNESDFRIIVDGIDHEPDFDEETGTLSLELDEPLKERFHAVTFEAETGDGETERETKIFYVDTSVDNMKTLVEHFEAEGAFENDEVVRSLNLHLTAVGQFEDQEESEKIVQHTEGLQDLLDYQHENDLISETAYSVLSNDADVLKDKWQ
ncbi:dipeptidase [Natribacillus halophilus]|uniref:Membrane dipeptidase n=1 Tax=Natribacillus halophilus TaxID=549003 RepID=A0A1G8MUB2_9BACI|nr:dipeptidase [Natribacillus halophilus]SDI71494.1 membrane dipeptidase [Natribacillus halophilus]